MYKHKIVGLSEEEIRKTYKILIETNHPHLADYYEMYEDGNHFYVIMAKY
jgi:hypothetical protein